MSIHVRTFIVIVATVGSLAWSPLNAQVPSAAPAGDVEIYEAFRAWVNQQPPDTRSTALERYKQVLGRQGLKPAEVERRLQVIDQHGERLEVERWNRILTAPSPTFNTEPNAFLVRMTQGRAPGKALDVGMGQGRNAIYLAKQGWSVTGFDPAEQAVAMAQQEAKRLGVSLATLTVGDEQFEFGRDQWDLIVLSYVSLRHLTSKVYESLKPGGLVVVEAVHRDATKDGPIGSGVVFDTNELLKLFERFRIVHYEDAPAIGDFGGKRSTRVVRLAAERP